MKHLGMVVFINGRNDIRKELKKYVLYSSYNEMRRLIHDKKRSGKNLHQAGFNEQKQ